MSENTELVYATVLKTHANHRSLTENDLKEKYLIDLSETLLDGRIEIPLETLKKLASDISLSLAMFFIDCPNDFAKLSPRDERSRTLDPFSPKTLHAITRVEEYINYYLKYSDKEEPINLPSFTIKDSAQDAARIISNILGFEDLRRKGRINDLFRNLKTEFEKHNILVFTEKFPSSETRGFTIHKEKVAAIALTLEETVGARIFTMLHELGHILLQISGISDSSNTRPTNKTEVWCNNFAGEIYYPYKKMQTYSINLNDPLADIRTIALELKGSLGGVAYNLVKAKRLPIDVYNEYFRDYDFTKDNVSETVSSAAKKGGPPWARTVVSRKGKAFTKTIATAYSEEKLSISDTLKILNIKSKHLDAVIQEANR